MRQPSYLLKRKTNESCFRLNDERMQESEVRMRKRANLDRVLPTKPCITSRGNQVEQNVLDKK